MNDCAIVKDLLPLYFDGETSPGTSSFIKDHLASCPSCREYFRAGRGTLRSASGDSRDVSRDGRYRYTDLAKRVRKTVTGLSVGIASGILGTAARIGFLLSKSGSRK